jgi:creatinine amidohydrolase
MLSPLNRLDALSWPQAKAALNREGSTVVWPFGACEQHGPQLPLTTDALFAERILQVVLEQLPSELPIWALPVQAIGFSPEHAGFPGTLSLSADLLIRLLEEVGSQLADAGAQRLVLFNAHGGQIGLLQAAARSLRALRPSLAVLPCFLWSGVAGLEALLPEQEAREGLHAGLAETSLMLALAPHLVGSERPVDGLHHDPSLPATPPPGWSLEGHAPCAWFTRELSATGVIGDSRQASEALGKALEDALVRHWLDRFQALLASDWPPRAQVIRL